MKKTRQPALKMHTYERFDGSLWRNYETADSLVTVTQAGRRLISSGVVSFLLRTYSADYEAGRESQSDTRRFLAEGGNARVFSLGNSRLAVKESRPLGDQLLDSMNRMDRLVNAVEHHSPRWIDIPRHYATLISKDDPCRQFMLMQKIDDGVTIGDVINYYDVPREPHLKESIGKIYGEVTPELIDELKERHFEIRGELRKALKAEYLSPDEFLPDIDNNPYNIVIDRLPDPVADSSIKFWIIDQ